MRAYRGEPYQAALRCAAHTQHVYETCFPSRRKTRVQRATIVLQVCPTRHSVRRRRRSEGLHSGLRPVVAVSGAEAAAAADGVGCVAGSYQRLSCVTTGGASLQPIALRCNRQSGDPTGRAVLRWQRHAGVCAYACGRAQAGRRPALVGTGLSGNAPEWDVPNKPERERASERPCCAVAAMRAPSVPSALQHTAGMGEMGE